MMHQSWCIFLFPQRAYVCETANSFLNQNTSQLTIVNANGYQFICIFTLLKLKIYFMTKILPLLFFYFTYISIGFCNSKPIQNKQYPNYGLLQYFVPSHSLKTNVNSLACYLNQDFQPGKIVTIDNQTITPEGIRYNISEEVIECQINKQYGRISSPNKISEVKINGVPYVYKKYIIKGDSLSGYLQKIHSGDKNLYVKYFVRKSNLINATRDIKNIFFIEENGKYPKKISSLKSEIIKIYENKKGFANSYMKKNNFSWNDSKALIKLVNYLENLNANKVASR